MSKVFFTADIHAGADKFGLNTRQWLEPFAEVIDEATKGDSIIVAGDVFHRRNPTVLEYDSLIYLLQTTYETCNEMDVYLLAGNHDMLRPDQANALSLLRYYVKYVPETIDERSIFQIKQFGGPDDPHTLKVGMLNWPMLEMFNTAEDQSIDEQLQAAKDELIGIIKGVMDKAGLERLDVITGHAHLIGGSGETMGDAPNLLAGRDILLPADFIESIADFVMMGHIHTPTKHYIGSTQPTDIRDTEQKRYVVWDSETGEMVSHPYKSSLRLMEVSITPEEDLGAAIRESGYSPGLEIDSQKVGIHLIVQETEATLAPFDTTAARRALSEQGFFYIRISIIPHAKSRRMSDDEAEAIDDGTEEDEIVGGSRAYLNSLKEEAYSPDDKEGALAAISKGVLPEQSND